MTDREAARTLDGGHRQPHRAAAVAEFDCVANADRVLDRLLAVVESLARFPERGSYPKELLALGIKEYRHAMLEPYRIIYKVSGNQVPIYLIADGRRDMQSVLARRLLGA